MALKKAQTLTDTERRATHRKGEIQGLGPPKILHGGSSFANVKGNAGVAMTPATGGPRSVGKGN